LPHLHTEGRTAGIWMTTILNESARDGEDVNEFTFVAAPLHMETGMFGDGDDAGHCSNGAWNYAAASAEDRATFRLWIRGVIVFYVGLLTISGAVAIVSHDDAGLRQIADLYAQVTAAPVGSNKNASDAIRPPATTKSAWW
jgi:hypothetical protein